MVEQRPYGGDPRADPNEYRYFGPFGPGPNSIPGASQHDRPQPFATAAGQSSYPAPTASPMLPPYGGSGFAPQQPPRRLGGAAVVGVAALTALLIGTAAGFGGSKLADLTAGPTVDPAPASSPAPSRAGTRAPLPSGPNRANTVEVAKTVLPSTVMIRAGNGTDGSTGSGFVLDTQGRILTNNHVVEEAADGGRIEVVFDDGRRDRATIVGRSPSYDLAVIKVAASKALVPMQIGNSDETRVGETVIAVGAPLALPGTVTEGIISSTNRPVVVNKGGNADAPSAYINAIQTDAPINPGNSGGPLIDAAARVIGVNSAILTLGESQSQAGNIGLGFAIPINQAIEIGELLIKDGKATYPVIGANVSESGDGSGVELTTVERNGPADDAGLRNGDKVISIDGKVVTGIEQLIVTIRTHRPKDVVELGFKRGSSTETARVKLGSKEG